MTKPRRYGGKSHPGMPTQEQTRPITTETSNLYKKNCFWYLLQRRALKKQKLQVDDQTVEIWWKISSRDANSGANETNIDGNYQSIQKIRCFWCLLQRRALKKKACKLMTKPRRYGEKSHPAQPTQEQTRPISTETSNLVEKSTLFLISPAKPSLEKTKVASWWPNRADMAENLITRPQLRSKRDQYRRKLAI